MSEPCFKPGDRVVTHNHPAGEGVVLRAEENWSVIQLDGHEQPMFYGKSAVSLAALAKAVRP